MIIIITTATNILTYTITITIIISIIPSSSYGDFALIDYDKKISFIYLLSAFIRFFNL